MWDLVAMVMSDEFEATVAQKASKEGQKQAAQQIRREAERRQPMPGQYLTGDGCWVKPAALTSRAKCPGCGSHEWRQHNNVRICAYCRCGQ